MQMIDRLVGIVPFSLKKSYYLIKRRPMMSTFEANLLRDIILENRIASVLEYGSGGSTLYFSRYVKKWTAVESNRAWYEFLVKHVDKNVDLICLTEKEDYVRIPEQSSYDLILIDGNFREECISVAADYFTTRKGFVLLHDSGRKQYAKHLGRFRHVIHLTRGRYYDAEIGYKKWGLALLTN